MAIVTFEIENPPAGNKTNNVEYLLKVNNMYLSSINKSPLGDCQTYTIAKMASICNYENWLEILKAIQKKINKNQLLINVNSNNAAHIKLKEFFKEDITFEKTYMSTYNSSMTMMLIKTIKLKE